MRRLRRLLPCALTGLVSWTSSIATAAEPASWSDRHEIVVRQRIPYERAGRTSLSAYAGVIPNDPFVVYFPVGVRLAHHLNESLGLDLSTSYLDTLVADRALRSEIGSPSGATAEVVLRDAPVMRSQLGIGWSLFAAKARRNASETLNLRGTIRAGFGALLTRNDRAGLLARPEAFAGLGIATHVDSMRTFDVEIRQMMFQRDEGGVLMPTEISLGLTHHFGGPLEGYR